MDFFGNSGFSTIKIEIFKLKLLPRLAIFGGFEHMVSISMKNWSFDVFYGLQIKEDLRLQTSFFVARKNGIFLYDLFTKNLQFYCQVTPQIFLVALFFFAK